MQDQRGEIERNDSLKGLGHPRQEAAKIVAAGNRPGQRQDRFINVIKRGTHGCNHNFLQRH